MKLVADHGLFRHRQLGLLHQPFDKVAIALGRRHTASGRMRLGQVPQLSQRCQLVANGSRTNPQSTGLADGIGTNSFGGGDVLAHHKAQGILLSLGQLFHNRSPITRTRLALSPTEC